MFILGAIIILIVSFAIAFLSLIREQRKLKREDAQVAADLSTAQKDSVADIEDKGADLKQPSSVTASEHVDSQALNQATEPAVEPKKRFVPSLDNKPPVKTVEPEAAVVTPPASMEPVEVEKPKLEPFPWEVKESMPNPEVNTTPPVATAAQVDAVKDHFILHPKATSRSFGSSVSLRDLADKK